MSTSLVLNIRSLLNPLKYTAIADLAESYQVALFALTETWITSSSTSSELFNATPPGFTLMSCPRSTPATKSHIVGGGTAFLIREPAFLLSTPTQTFKSFEMPVITLKLFSSNLTIFNSELDTFLSLAAITPHEFLITGDFNLHLDDPNDSQ